MNFLARLITTALLAALAFVAVPATAHATTETDCAEYVVRMNVLAESWQEKSDEAEVWKARAAALTTNLAASEARATGLEVELSEAAARVERLRAKVQELRDRLRSR